MGASEAVNELVRAGLVAERTAPAFRQPSHDLGRGIDSADVADAIETLDGPRAR